MDIVPVDSAERVAEATAVLTLAFADDPVTRWMYPRPALLLDAFGRLVHAFGRAGFEGGTASLVGNGDGAAVWLPPGTTVDEQAMEAVLTDDVPDDVRPEALEFFGALDAYHPHHEHWYLPLIGVEPAIRGRGTGSALLTEGLRHCDADHVDVYLESTHPRNLPLYRRFGFEELGTVQVGSSPPMTAMLRPAR